MPSDFTSLSQNLRKPFFRQRLLRQMVMHSSSGQLAIKVGYRQKDGGDDANDRASGIEETSEKGHMVQKVKITDPVHVANRIEKYDVQQTSRQDQNGPAKECQLPCFSGASFDLDPHVQQ